MLELESTQDSEASCHGGLTALRPCGVAALRQCWVPRRRIAAVPRCRGAAVPWCRGHHRKNDDLSEFRIRQTAHALVVPAHGLQPWSQALLCTVPRLTDLLARAGRDRENRWNS
mmetsp:Transcript_37647/g.51654  ORF Transcript_37647/g.51654 Transcript_37647/m.51654 type:complete len:114 (+) Transcript_37647:23-364(+)